MPSDAGPQVVHRYGQPRHRHPFPEHTGFKGILRRMVQLLERHRDMYFENADESLRPSL